MKHIKIVGALLMISSLGLYAAQERRISEKQAQEAASNCVSNIIRLAKYLRGGTSSITVPLNAEQQEAIRVEGAIVEFNTPWDRERSQFDSMTVSSPVDDSGSLQKRLQKRLQRQEEAHRKEIIRMQEASREQEGRILEQEVSRRVAIESSAEQLAALNEGYAKTVENLEQQVEQLRSQQRQAMGHTDEVDYENRIAKLQETVDSSVQAYENMHAERQEARRELKAAQNELNTMRAQQEAQPAQREPSQDQLKGSWRRGLWQGSLATAAVIGAAVIGSLWVWRRA